MTSHNNSAVWSMAVIMLLLFDLTPSVPNFDSAYYLFAGQHLFAGRLDCLRTPTYPILVNAFNVMFGDRGMVIALTIIQSIVYLLSVYSLTNIIERVICNRIIGLCTALFYVVVISPAWCNEVATESLSLSGCVILVDLVLKFLDNSKLGMSIAVHSILLLLVFLRPTFVLFFAIFPCLWIFQWIKSRKSIPYVVAMVMTVLCVGVYWGYTSLYESQYGKRTSSFSFECNIYNLKRSGCWDRDVITNRRAKELCEKIDDNYSCNYDPIYRIVDTIPASLPLISDACNEMVQAHKSQYNRYRMETLVSSFDSRFPGAVNTTSHLGVILFIWSLFLSLPLSLFYLIVPICVAALLVYVIIHKRIPLAESLIIAVVFAQYLGIAYSASEAHARLMLPVYGLFVVLLGVVADKVVQYCSH